jgi:hypothetical protein
MSGCQWRECPPLRGHIESSPPRLRRRKASPRPRFGCSRCRPEPDTAAEDFNAVAPAAINFGQGRHRGHLAVKLYLMESQTKALENQASELLSNKTTRAA